MTSPAMQAVDTRRAMLSWLQTEVGMAYMDTIMPENLDKRSRVNHTVALAGLTHGDTYWAGGRAHELISVASRTMPLDVPITPYTIPSMSGFLALETPIETTWARYPGVKVFIECLTWGVTVRPNARSVIDGNHYRIADMNFTDRDPTPDEANNVIFGVWCRPKAINWRPAKDRPIIASMQGPAVLVFSCSFTDEPDAEPRTSTLAELQRLDPDESFLEALKYLVAFFQFTRQRVTVTVDERLDRATERRADAWGKRAPRLVSPIKVITLRRADRPHSEPAGERREVDWSCQWFVDGHWRRQWYRSKGTHEDIFIAGYRKGPVDKPFRDVDGTVFDVRR